MNADVDLELMTARAGSYQVVSRWVPLRDGPADVDLEAEGVSWTARWTARAGECFETQGPPIPLGKGPFRLRIAVAEDLLVLDELAIRPAAPQAPSGKGVDN